MTRQPSARIVELDISQLEARLDHVERELGEETSRPLRLLLASYTSLLSLLQEKHLSVTRLRRMVFGARTERTRNVAGASTSHAAEPTGHG